MKRAGAVNQIGTIHTDNLAFGKHVLDYLSSSLIVLVSESGNKNHFIADIEIDVTLREAGVSRLERRRSAVEAWAALSLPAAFHSGRRKFRNTS
jgi:hypothetical protein